MKKLFIAFLLLSVCTAIFADGFIHPLDFRGTETEKQAVISFIEKDVKERYTAIGMGDPATLRMMENEELDAFKQLTNVTNRKLLDEVIRTYTAIGMGNYSTILMMYNEQLEASQQKLKW